MRLIIAGKRDFPDKSFVFSHIDNFVLRNGTPDEIISGGANGVDTFAKEYALQHKYVFKEFLADWEEYGKSAGPIRNKKMAEYASKDNNPWLLAFWDGRSKGTKNMIETGKKYQIQSHIVNINEEL